VRERRWRWSLAIGSIPPGCVDNGADYCFAYVAATALARSITAGAGAATLINRVAPSSVPPLFSQTTASSTFRHGDFAGESLGDVAAAVRAGKVGAADLPVDVIVRNGETLALNTRSSLVLRRGGIDPADWVLNDVTGNPLMEQILTERLLRNQTEGGVDVLRITGAGSNASNIG